MGNDFQFFFLNEIMRASLLFTTTVLWHAGMHITANGFRQQVRDVPCHAFHASSSEYVVFFLAAQRAPLAGLT